jgi:uncharacterized membrane protein
MVSWLATGLAGQRSALASVAAATGRASRRAHAARGALVAGLRLLLRAVLIVAGLVLGTLAAWQLGVGWGLLAAGLSCWILEAVIKDGGERVGPGRGTADQRGAR